MAGTSNAAAGPSRRRWAGSDSEEEEHTSPRRPSKRQKTPIEDAFDDLDEFHSDVEEIIPATLPNGHHGNGRANGDGANGHEEDSLDGVMVGEGPGSEDDVAEVAEEDRGRVEFRPEYQRDKDGYVAGSIVRIKCKGFMTYDLVEFRPGPHLNMILGPNGTGKSSIAAAIAIGLGFPAKVMGRANDIKAYVKQGTEQAITEIELKGLPKKKNVTIKRRFTRENDTSEWFLNGVSCTKKAVTETVTSMGIQANNLCSFLPQDKVAEFARMNPVTVLRETMRAAGDPRLTRWHEKLCEWGDKERDLSTVLEGAIEKRDNLQAMVDRDEPDVQAFQERERNEFERDVLQILLVVNEVNVLASRHEQLKKDRAALRAQLAHVSKKRKPLTDLKDKQTEKQHKAEARVVKGDDELATYNDRFRTANRKFDAIQRKSEEVDQKLVEVKRDMQKLERDKEQERTRIRNAESQLGKPKAQLTEQYQAKMRQATELKDKARYADRDISNLNDEYQDREQSIREDQRKIEARTKHLGELQSLEKARERDARDLDSSIGYMLDWIEQNSMKLERTVHKPPMISVNVTKRELAWQIEAGTSIGHRKTFICESEKDYLTLTALNGKFMPNGQMIRCNVTYQVVTEDTVNPRRPCTQQQLRSVGLEHFAIDCVEAAPAVIAFLNDKCRMHMAAVTSRPSKDVDSDAVCKLGIRFYTTAQNSNRITQSNYGLRQFSIASSGPVPARAFNKIVDTAKIKQVADEKAELMTRLREAEAPQRELKVKMDKARDALARFKKDSAELQMEANDLKKEIQKINLAETDIQMAKNRLRELEAKPNGEARKAKLRKDKLDIVKEIRKPIEDHQSTSAEALTSIDELVKWGLAGRQMACNLEAIDQKLKDRDVEFNDLEEEIAAVHGQIDEVRNQHGQAAHKTKRMLETKSQATSEAVEERRFHIKDAQDLQSQLEDVMAQLEHSAGIDPAILRRFEKNREALDELIAQVSKRERDSTTIREKIDTLLRNFDPALDSLVQVVSDNFGAAFEKVGCSGEVRVDRVEGDFRNWGIQILVSYRNEEGLALLTSNRQSGGERSLATVTYLMSLSEMARTPFSLVDEINQGMDKKYERSVHNQLVGVTCAEDAGQYFLITPKLLVGLHYHPKMKILIVNNGIHLPESTANASGFGSLTSRLKQYQKTITAH